MTKDEFLRELENLLEVPAGSIKGDERLDAIEGWDSLAILGFIAMVDGRLGIVLPTQKLSECETVPELLDLVKDKVAA